MNVHWKGWCWTSNTWATWCEESTHWKISWCWERLRAGGEEGDRGWDGWITSPTQWMWVWANSGKEWRTGKLGMLPSTGSQRVGRDLMTNNNNKYIYSGQQIPLLITFPCSQEQVWNLERHSRYSDGWILKTVKMGVTICS